MMKIQKLNLAYFSPTGGTQTAVRTLAKAWETLSAEEIDLCTTPEPKTFAKDELVIFGVPSFGGRVPETALQRWEQLRGTETPCILLAAYGNRDYEDTLLEMKDFAKAQGFLPFAAIAAVCEHSIARQYAAGRPDAEDKATLLRYGSSIAEALSHQENASFTLAVNGNHPYKEKKGGAPMMPGADDACCNCMVCAKSCPVQAISFENVKKTNPELCVSCMRCVKVCPTGARHLPAQVLEGVGARLQPVCSEPKPYTLFLPETDE